MASTQRLPMSLRFFCSEDWMGTSRDGSFSISIFATRPNISHSWWYSWERHTQIHTYSQRFLGKFSTGGKILKQQDRKRIIRRISAGGGNAGGMEEGESKKKQHTSCAVHLRLPTNGLAVCGSARMWIHSENVFFSLWLPVASLPFSPLLYNPATMEIWRKKKKPEAVSSVKWVEAHAKTRGNLSRKRGLVWRLSHWRRRRSTCSCDGGTSRGSDKQPL